MRPLLSPDTQAILLMTAPLIAGQRNGSPDMLSPAEYRKFARRLREIDRQPGDLLTPDANAIIRDCQSVVDASRLHRLLERGFLLSHVAERWRSRAIWILGHTDTDYPSRLKTRLREDAPAVLYGCGDIGLSEAGGLAVVGSRNATEALIDYTQSIGRLAATAGKTVISGGARGIDRAAISGALEQGGQATAVLADSLESTAMVRENRNAIMDNHLLLISPFDPLAGFNVGNAMRRNRLIYALSEAALVVDADVNKGGTWAGATEQLDKLRLVPVYVRTSGEASAGCDALRQKGAVAWPDPSDSDALHELFTAPAPRKAQNDFPFASVEPSPLPALLFLQEPEHAFQHAPNPAPAADNPANIVLAAAREAICHLLVKPMNDADIAQALNVSHSQTKLWLQLLVDEGAVEKRKRPSVYVRAQSRLFG